MALVNAQLPTLLDMVKRMAPGGAIDTVVELLTARNAFLQDAVFAEGNLPTGHRFTVRSGLPAVQWRRFNEGINPSKSKTDQLTESCGMLTGMSVLDAEEAKINGNAAAFRASEDSSFAMALANQLETAFFYASTASTPEQIMGLAPRLNTSTSSTVGSQIFKHDGAASGNNNASVWLVGWGPKAVSCIFPKGSAGGITPHDMGEQLWDDGTGKKFRAFVTDWTWKVGLMVQDYRYIARIANIYTPNLSTTGNALIQTMIKAYHQIYDPKQVRLAWYCNRSIATYLHLQALDSTKQSTLSIERVGGEPVTMFLGIPVRQSDALLSTEATIT